MSQSARNHRKSFPEDIEDVYPLTPLQHGMLFHALYDAQPGVDIEQLVFSIQADLDLQAFEAAWQRVVDRHAILRTSFHWEDLDEPQQRVHKNGRLSFCREDWRTLSSDEQHRVKDGGARQPFFFFHGDFNGGGFYCLNLARGLSEDQPFYAVQPHGLDGNAIPVTIEAMAKAHLMELREIQPRGPYLLGGYCNGAVISFEIARLIEAEGEKVDLLVLLCASVSNALRFRFLRNFVDCLSGVKNLEAEDRLNRFLTYRARLLRIREIKSYYRTRISDFFRLPAGERLSFVREKSLTAGRNLVRSLVSIANVGAQDGKQESDDHNGVIDAHRERVSAAYAKAVLGYVPRQYHGKAVVLWPSELPLEEPEDPTAGWSKVAASVELLRVPGGHITCVTSHVEHVANALRVCLDEVANGSGYCVVQEGAEAEDQADRGCEKSYDTIAAFETIQN